MRASLRIFARDLRRLVTNPAALVIALGVCLLSQRSPEQACHIYILPASEAGDFFFMRSDHYPFTP